jgi:hypothetical protein
MRQRVQVSPPSVDILCAMTFERFSDFSFGRRMLVAASKRFPPSIGTIVQNGITVVSPLEVISDQELPSSFEWA